MNMTAQEEEDIFQHEAILETLKALGLEETDETYDALYDLYEAGWGSGKQWEYSHPS
jgi:hypothetical protein